MLGLSGYVDGSGTRFSIPCPLCVWPSLSGSLYPDDLKSVKCYTNEKWNCSFEGARCGVRGASGSYPTPVDFQYGWKGWPGSRGLLAGFQLFCCDLLPPGQPCLPCEPTLPFISPACHHHSTCRESSAPGSSPWGSAGALPPATSPLPPNFAWRFSPPLPVPSRRKPPWSLISQLLPVSVLLGDPSCCQVSVSGAAARAWAPEGSGLLPDWVASQSSRKFWLLLLPAQHWVCDHTAPEHPLACTTPTPNIGNTPFLPACLRAFVGLE